MKLATMEFRKREKFKSYLKMLLLVWMLNSVVIVAANHSEMQLLKNRRNSDVSLKNIANIDLRAQEIPLKKNKKSMEQFMDFGNEVHEGLKPIGNNSVGIDCGSSHYACSDDKTCCPLGHKCCASKSPNGMMACCSATDIDVSSLKI